MFREYHTHLPEDILERHGRGEMHYMGFITGHLGLRLQALVNKSMTTATCIASLDTDRVTDGIFETFRRIIRR